MSTIMSNSLNVRSALLVNTLACGIELIACAGFTYIPPLLRKSGHSEATMALTMGIGPLLGFLFVPYIGEASDNFKSRYGRRRPFIFVLSIVAALSFIYMPYIKSWLPVGGLAHVVVGKETLFPWNMQKVTLIVTCFVVLFDFSSQVALSPFEALLADMGKPLGTGASEAIYQIYSFMVGVGGIFGYLITSLDWKNGANFLSNVGANTQEERVFFVTFCLFIITLFISMRYSKDVSSAVRRVKLDSNADAVPLACAMLPVPSSFRKCLRLICPSSFIRIFNLPSCFKRLCVYQFFAWTSLMSYNLFFTDFVGEIVFEGDPSPEAGTLKNDLYDEGVSVGSMGLLTHCVACCAFPILQKTCLKSLSTRLLLAVVVFMSTAAVFVMIMVPKTWTMVVMSIFPGLLMGALTSVPFHLLTKYHDKEDVFFADSQETRGVGTDVAILDSMYFLAEFALSVFDSVFVMLIGSSYAYMYATVAFGLVALVLVFYVVFDESQLNASSLHIKGLSTTSEVKDHRDGALNSVNGNPASHSFQSNVV